MLLGLTPNIYAQIDTNQNLVRQSHCFAKKLIVPVALMSTGTLVSNSRFEKELQKNIRRHVGRSYHNAIDDYTQYIPVIQLYIGELIGFETERHWFDRTKNLLMSNLLSAGLTHSLKHIINKQRPNGENFAFPSGHTSFAFTNASVLAHEYSSSKAFGYSGFLFAGVTGVFRQINNKHWISDVLFGAGVGILSTELIYHFKILNDWNPLKESQQFSLLPFYGPSGIGAKLYLRL